MRGVVIYAVGSPVVVELEASVARAGLTVVAAVRNTAGPDYLTDKSALINLTDLTPRILSHPYLVPLFTPGNRRKAVQEAQELGLASPFSLIDASVAAPLALEYGQGLYVNAGSAIGGASQFDESVFINRGANIGHHVQLGAYVSIGPGAIVAGMVRVGRGTVIGAGAVVLPELTIGSNSVVGAGSVVTRNVPDNCLVLGNPARIVREDIVGYKDLAVP